MKFLRLLGTQRARYPSSRCRTRFEKGALSVWGPRRERSGFDLRQFRYQVPLNWDLPGAEFLGGGPFIWGETSPLRHMHLARGWAKTVRLLRRERKREIEREGENVLSARGACGRRWYLLPHSDSNPPTASLRTKTMDSGGFDSSRILILRGGTLMSKRNFPDILSQ